MKLVLIKSPNKTKITWCQIRIQRIMKSNWKIKEIIEKNS